jgi:hypothetical protein
MCSARGPVKCTYVVVVVQFGGFIFVTNFSNCTTTYVVARTAGTAFLRGSQLGSM